MVEQMESGLPKVRIECIETDKLCFDRWRQLAHHHFQGVIRIETPAIFRHSNLKKSFAKRFECLDVGSKQNA